MKTPHQWIVGVDLTPRSRGAARWAAWLSETSRHKPHLTALHAGEFTDFRDEHPGPGSPIRRAREATEASLNALHVRGEYDHIRVVDSDSAVDALLEEVRTRGARGLVIGRIQPAESWTMISLGAVARRVLRATDDPVFVVPPDYEPPRDPGPIVVGVTPSGDALVATEMARSLGEELGLPVECVHVMPGVSAYLAGPERAIVPTATPLHTQLTFEEQAREAMKAWMHEHHIERPLHFEVGDTPRGLDAAARRLGATFVVTGSRQLSTVDRLFQRSVGSDLASRAHVPTLVVPPVSSQDAAVA